MTEMIGTTVAAARAELVDEPAFDGHEPGLGRHEDREGDLNVGAAPMEPRVDRIDKVGPAVLQVRDHHHADDPCDQLKPTVRFPHVFLRSPERLALLCSAKLALLLAKGAPLLS